MKTSAMDPDLKWAWRLAWALAVGNLSAAALNWREPSIVVAALIWTIGCVLMAGTMFSHQRTRDTARAVKRMIEESMPPPKTAERTPCRD